MSDAHRAESLEVARRTFVALLRAGTTLHALSLTLLGATALLGAALVAWNRPAGAATRALLSVSILAALVEAYFAFRVRVDAELLDAMERRRESGVDLEPGRESGVRLVKGGAPLADGMGTPDARDPLDPHRRSARLVYRQGAWVAVQAVAFGAALVLALS